jgi:hypothetical protein
VIERESWASIFEAEERPPTLVTLPGHPQPVAVPTILRNEARWSGELPDSFRAVPNKPAIDFHGRPLYPEFVWLRLLERAGWTGAWAKNWHGHEFWSDINMPFELPKAQAGLFKYIESLTGNTRGGYWDIFAWRGDDIVFIESKQRGKKIRPAQAVWLEKSIDFGFDVSSFLVAQYTVPKKVKQEVLS